jgi:phosphoribosylanthranilate isomerase
MTVVKICGIKTLEEALAAVDAGADYLGFNFYSRSVRYVEFYKFADIATVLKRHHPSVKIVGVFVNSSEAYIESILKTGLLDLVQLHGDESPEFCAAFGDKAFKAYRGLPVTDSDRYIRKAAPALLLDAAVKGSYGGTGLTTDWLAAAALAKQFPLILAGGLNPENVTEAVQQVNPWGVDVASGVESSPGIKDPVKMKAFVQAVHFISKPAPQGINSREYLEK